LILVIDNYDSFTYNLVDLVKRYAPVRVARNDALTVAEIRSLCPEGILISPGPGRPAGSGVSVDVVTQLAGEIPLFGVCLGHQLIGEVFGATVTHAPLPMHGKTSDIVHTGKLLFEGLPSPLRVMRYHSLVIAPETVPGCLEILARTTTGEIMAIRHRSLPIVGVQFHPESILSECGERLMLNWLRTVSSTSAPTGLPTG